MNPLFGLAVLAAVAALQPQERPPAEATIELGFARASGRAGEEVELPVTLKSEQTVAEPFRITLAFPPAVLDYRGFKTAYLAEYAGWVMAARLRPPRADDKRAVVEITVDPGKKAFFPSGVVGYAQFRIQKDVPDGDIPIDAELTLPPSVPLRSTVERATVTVYTNLITSCFFYMH
jgi:hypothetical protein